MTKKTTKRALFASVISMLLCVAMLIGSTFAWFTDTAKTNVNSIQAGTLDIQLLNTAGENLEGQTLNFSDLDDNIYWEPGSTYALEPVVVKNAGTLALKYKIIISGIDGDAKLNEAIEWTMNGDPIGTDTEYHLGVGESHEVTIKGHMMESAGNEYQGLSIEGIAIAVTAAQDTVEYDSETNQYDAGALYSEIEPDDYVAPGEDLAARLEAAEVGDVIALKTGSHVLTRTVETKGILVVEANDTATLDLGGNTISVAVLNTINAPSVYNYGKLTIENGTISNKNATAGNTNVAAVHNVSGELTLKNCTIQNVAPTSGGNYCVVVDGGHVTLENCTVVGSRGGIAVANEGSVTMNGGSVSASVYYPLYTRGTGNSTFNGVTFTKQNNSKGKAITYNCFSEGTAVFTGCTFVSETSSLVNLDISEVYTGFTFENCVYTNVNNPNE